MKKILAIFPIILALAAAPAFASGTLSPLSVDLTQVDSPGYFNITINSVAGTYDANGYAIDLFDASGNLALSANGPFMSTGNIIGNCGLGVPCHISDLSNYGGGSVSSLPAGSYTLVLGDGDFSGFMTNCNDAGLTLTACRAVYGPGGTTPNADWQEISFSMFTPAAGGDVPISAGDFTLPSFGHDLLASVSNIVSAPGILAIIVLIIALTLAFTVADMAKDALLRAWRGKRSLSEQYDEMLAAGIRKNHPELDNF